MRWPLTKEGNWALAIVLLVALGLFVALSALLGL